MAREADDRRPGRAPLVHPLSARGFAKSVADEDARQPRAEGARLLPISPCLSLLTTPWGATWQVRLAEKQAAAAIKMIHGQFRLEKLQLIEKFKQQKRNDERRGSSDEEMVGSLLGADAPRPSGRKFSTVLQSAHHGASASMARPMPKQTDGSVWHAPKRFGFSAEDGEGGMSNARSSPCVAPRVGLGATAPLDCSPAHPSRSCRP